LTSLRVVDTSEADFLLNCRIIDRYGHMIERTSEPPRPIDSEPHWKKVIRGIYTVIFVVAWTFGVASFFFFGNAFGRGSPVPTATQTEPLADHGKTVFVTPRDKRRIDWFQLASGAGVPVVLVGVILHFVVGVKLFPNAPTLSEYLARKDSPKPDPPPAKLL
jgi:hypothetical protein